MLEVTTAGAKVALYARVSTDQGKQHLENQLRELRTYGKRMKWRNVAEYTDQISGRSQSRPGLDELFRGAAARLFDIVLVFDLTRLTRLGPATAWENIGRLKSAGVEFWSMKEEYFRTPGPAGPLLISIAAWMAEQERQAISDRVKAGLKRAKAQGIRIGRPRVVVDKSKVAAMRAEGLSIRKIAIRLKVDRNAVERVVRIQEAMKMVQPK